jgi:hypothetical protein
VLVCALVATCECVVDRGHRVVVIVVVAIVGLSSSSIALFSLQKFWFLATVVFLFVCGKHYLIME